MDELVLLQLGMGLLATLVTLVGAFFALKFGLKFGLNGLRQDVTEIKISVQKLVEDMQSHGLQLVSHDERLISQGDRLDKLEKKP